MRQTAYTNSTEVFFVEKKPEKRMFQAVLTPDELDGGYVVTVPGLPGCITEGDTVEEALKNAKEAISLYLEYLHDKGEEMVYKNPIIATVEVG